MADDIPYIGWRLVVFVSVVTPLLVLVTALRFYARSLTSRRFGLDDWLVLIALFGQFAATGLAVACLKHAGVGYHITWVAEDHPEAAEAFFKYLIAISSWYWATISLSKLAICIFYRILFPQRSVFIILCLVAGILISTAIISFIVGLAACRPFEAQWASPAVQAEKCIDKEKLYVWSTFPNIVTDVVLLVLPLPIIWNLHTSRQLKIALSGTFLLGGIGIVASILRFVSFNNTSSFIDATWNAVELYIWTLAEPSIYLIAACLITYRPLLEKFNSKVRSQVSSKWPSNKGPSAPGSFPYQERTDPTPTPRGHSSNDYLHDNDQGFLLSKYGARGQGFNQIPETEYVQHNAPPLGSPRSGIVKTTNIEITRGMTKNNGYQGEGVEHRQK